MIFTVAPSLNCRSLLSLARRRNDQEDERRRWSSSWLIHWIVPRHHRWHNDAKIKTMDDDDLDYLHHGSFIGSSIVINAGTTTRRSRKWTTTAMLLIVNRSFNCRSSLSSSVRLLDFVIVSALTTRTTTKTTTTTMLLIVSCPIDQQSSSASSFFLLDVVLASTITIRTTTWATMMMSLTVSRPCDHLDLNLSFVLDPVGAENTSMTMTIPRNCFVDQVFLESDDVHGHLPLLVLIGVRERQFQYPVG